MQLSQTSLLSLQRPLPCLLVVRKSGSAFTYSTFESWGLVTFIYYPGSFLLSIQHLMPLCFDDIVAITYALHFGKSFLLLINGQDLHRTHCRC